MANVQLAVAGDETTQVILSVPGVQGPAGSNLPSSGTTHQLLYKQSNTDYDTAWKLITNDNVDGAAAIAGTKISPNFGSQNVLTTGTSTAASFIPSSSGVPTNGLYLPAANNVALSTNGTGRLFIDSSGNVGVGGAASAWSYTALSVGFGGSAVSSDAIDKVQLGANFYRGSGADRFAGTGFATLYQQNAGAHAWFRSSASGTAGNAMTLNESMRITSTGELKHFGGGTEGSPAVYFAGSAPSNSLYVQAATGHVGIGSSNPQSIFDIKTSTSNGALSQGAYIYNPGTGDNAGAKLNLGVSGGGTIAENRSAGIAGYYNGAGTALGFYTTSIWGTGSQTVRAVIDNSGRVGIGTTDFAPASSYYDDLVVKNATAGTGCGVTIVANATNGFSAVDFADTDAAGRGRLTYSHSDDSLRFDVAGNEAFRVDSSRRLLVGTPTSPNAGTGQYALSVVQGYAGSATGEGIVSIARGKVATAMANTDTIGQILFTDNAGNTFSKITSFVDGTVSSTSDLPGALAFSTNPGSPATSPTERVRIGNAGKIEINLNSAGLYIANWDTGAGSSTVKYNTTTGQLTYDTSSRLVKENIENCPYGINELKQLKPRKYFRADDQRTEIGFIADEVIDLMPEFVPVGAKSIITKDASDTELIPVGVNYEKLTAVLTAALQEAVAKIESLEARLTAAGL